MTIVILDLDWFYDKTEIPNVNCMKLSSFHKQMGDKTYFINDMSELSMSYDKLYVWGENTELPPIGHKLLNDKRTILFGKRFELCGAKQLGKTILACRPDYTLYDTYGSKNSYTKANFISFYTNGGERIERRQEWHNTNKGIKRTIITDEVLWKQKPEDIVICLSEILEEPNIVFLNPISLKCLIENESVANVFCSLRFSSGTDFKWRNDVGQDVSSTNKIIAFLNKLKENTRSFVGAVPFKAQCGTWEEDLIRIIQNASLCKANKIKCFIPEVQNGHKVYSWLRTWLTSKINISFIEFLLFFTFAKKGVKWHQALNDETQWGNYQVKFLVKLLAEKKWQNLLPQLSIQWGNNYIDYSCINLKLIEEKAKLLL